MTDREQKKAAKAFVDYWADKGYEKGESQPFWLSLLRDVLGVEHPEQCISFEDQVHLDHTSFIDGRIAATKVMIEQKSIDKDLRKAIRQSDGTFLNPFQQAKRYISELPLSEHPRWVITCNFKEFLVYDMEKPSGEPVQILLKNLETDYYMLSFIVKQKSEMLKKEEQLSMDAGDLVGKLYDAILKQYKDPDSPETLKNLNMLCVRLVFCLYAEDSGVFDTHEMFGQYLKRFPVEEVHRKLRELFKVLNIPMDKREEYDEYMDDDLAAFPYVNGGLFAEDIKIPPFNKEIMDLLISDASEGFNWSEISPTIFGAVFESTLNQDTRRHGGMHYTSIENIHKVIDPLFLDALKKEYNEIMALKTLKIRDDKLTAFIRKIASLKFFDPACGSGNFLTESYIELRRLENSALYTLSGGTMMFDGEGEFDPISVKISQFYGIEINDFAVKVAQTALWIAEAKMLHETENLLGKRIAFLPLKTSANIHERNALRTDWESIVPKNELSYILGNPPFVGARLMNDAQKSDVFNIFDGVKNNGNLDYVSCWYKKAADLMKGTYIRTALVSTNSITQGEQVAILWKDLFDKGVHIDFAHRTFRWDSEANIMAHVHCVIVGFSIAPSTTPKRLFDNGTEKIVRNINGYLVEADDIVIDSRTKPICDIPELAFGNMPNDNKGKLSKYTDEQRLAIIHKYPQAADMFKPFLGAEEFINGKSRWCLWLEGVSPKAIMSVPPIVEAIDSVREARLKSSRKGTREQANTPMLFGEIRQPKSAYILIPRHSSEKRKYIPMGFMSPDVICGDSNNMIPYATTYHFGVLTSNVHMAWVRTVCGRIKSDYRYSKDIVYNNFPWCNPTQEQREKIEKTAQTILDVRAKYSDSSFADMYGEKMYLFPDLVKAHQLNDKAVMEAYGFWGKLNTESECVAALMKMYQQLTERK